VTNLAGDMSAERRGPEMDHVSDTHDTFNRLYWVRSGTAQGHPIVKTQCAAPTSEAIASHQHLD
jgi:hypothetical protein